MIDIATGVSIEPLNDPAKHESGDGRSQAAKQRAEAEHRQPDLKDTAAADPIRRGPGQHEEARDDDRVAVDRPLQTGHRGVQIVLDGGQRDVHDRHVHRHQEETEAACRKDHHRMVRASGRNGVDSDGVVVRQRIFERAHGLFPRGSGCGVSGDRGTRERLRRTVLVDAIERNAPCLQHGHESLLERPARPSYDSTV
jgi:hypothetical protein